MQERVPIFIYIPSCRLPLLVFFVLKPVTKIRQLSEEDTIKMNLKDVEYDG